jgi:hypothetical protein
MFVFPDQLNRANIMLSKLPVLNKLKLLWQSMDALSRSAKRQELQLTSIELLMKESLLQNIRQQARYQDRKRLVSHEWQAFSQHGEDGAIAEMLRRVGTDSRQFLEVGVGNGLENNTAYLLTQGWSGWWLEGSAQAVQQIRKNCGPYLSSGKLRLIEAFAQEANIRQLLGSAGVPDSLDVLSLDIDRHTWWLWKWVGHLRARVVIVEYNATFPPDVNWKIDYDPARHWDGTNWWGASLKAYETLGNEIGYALVGCDISGTNAYFVRKDLCGDLFAEPFTAENHFESLRYVINHRWGGGQPPGMIG